MLPIFLAQIDTVNDTTVTVTFNLGSLVTAIIVGLLAGFLASLLVRGRSYGLLGSLVLGVLGAIVGNFIFSLLNVSVPPSLLEGITIRFIDIIIAFIGALILLAIFVLLFGRRRV
jgi:uncharacterized membrane protein YeaQ/YmgE (transglycosylase-associated protein family)